MTKKSSQRKERRSSPGSSKKSERKRTVKEKLSPEQVTDLTKLRSFLGIKPDAWDYIIIGDGSGSTWERAMGWGAVLISSSSMERVDFIGGTSHGTNNKAELMSAFEPLSYLAGTDAGVPNGCRVHYIGDSQYLVNGLNVQDATWAASCKANRELWIATHATKRRGLVIRAHHIPREINTLSHDMANAGRKVIMRLLPRFRHRIDEFMPN